MPAISQITQKRSQRLEQAHKNPLLKLTLGCGAFFVLLAGITAILIALLYAELTRELPSVELLPSLLEPPDGLLLQPTRFYDRSGEYVIMNLEDPLSSGRQYLNLLPQEDAPKNTNPSYISENLVIATLAASDPNFWEHAGFSWIDIVNDNHPTLAQRLAYDLLLQDENPGVRRALRERILAAQITSYFGREKVLEWFINSANYGRLAYGAHAASQLYFEKSASDLSLAEAAMLAPVANEPAINPLNAPQAALERQKVVIQDMLRYRLITPDEGIQAAREELVFRNIPRPGKVLSIEDMATDLAPVFAKLALQQLTTQVLQHKIERGGLRVITTLDYDLQSQTACTTERQLKWLNGNEILQSTDDCATARLLPTFPFEISKPQDDIQAEILFINPENGQILALIGEPSAGLDHAVLSDHPIGSLNTPFIYLTGFTRGMGPASLVWDIPQENAKTQNFDKDSHGPVRLRIALANDYLLAAKSVLSQVGVENVTRTAEQLGIYSPLRENNDALINMEIIRDSNLLELAQAFAIVANQGMLTGHTLGIETSDTISDERMQSSQLTASSILRVEDVTGNVILDLSVPQKRPILSPQLAFLLTDILSDEAARWPSLDHPNPLEIGRQAAVKYSRTNNAESNWIIGYTPRILLGIWLGSETSSFPQDSIRAVQHATMGLWHALIKSPAHDQTQVAWLTPAGISEVWVCDPSGLLPTKDCPNVVEEIFLAGTEPIQADTLYKRLPINRLTNMLATTFTSPELVDNREFLVVPPEAAKWSQQAGVELPPVVYDTIPIELSEWPESRITSPSMFEIINGRVPILGTAHGEEFDYYRIQTGSGLNPPAWRLLENDNSLPVDNGILTNWDTNGLSGLHAIQLIVVNKDKSVGRVTTLVTIDNTPPDVFIIYPYQNEEISRQENGIIVFRAEIEDDIGIEDVRFILDNQTLAELTQPPYALSWPTRLGTHIFRVEVTDLAGNTSESNIQFKVY